MTRIEKDLYTGKYIVWKIHRNYQYEMFRGFKYQCEEFLKNVK